MVTLQSSSHFIWLHVLILTWHNLNMRHGDLTVQQPFHMTTCLNYDMTQSWHDTWWPYSPAAISWLHVLIFTWHNLNMRHGDLTVQQPFHMTTCLNYDMTQSWHETWWPYSPAAISWLHVLILTWHNLDMRHGDLTVQQPFHMTTCLNFDMTQSWHETWWPYSPAAISYDYMS